MISYYLLDGHANYKKYRENHSQEIVLPIKPLKYSD